MTSEPDKPKPRRRFWQYSLRTFFVLLTVFCVWLGWTVYRANEQRKAVEWVREMGGSVWYDYQWNEPPGPNWLVQLLGVDYFQDVVVVDLNNAQASEAQVEELRKALPNCKIHWWPPDPSP